MHSLARSFEDRFRSVGSAVVFGAVVLCCCFTARAGAQVVVDLSAHTGPVMHGASGWLYGQAEDGIPTDNMMEPLRPQIAAQKPPRGLQHPAGDALHVTEAFRRAGGKEMQIYLQDIYPDWTYNKNGMDDYLAKVRAIVTELSADPNHAMFTYVPFNEPEFNWYGYSGEPFMDFLRDWKTVYEAIRAIDPKAKIVGPNFSVYRSETFRQFFTFARDNHVLPDEVSWHELQDNFFSGWDDTYKDYRRIETDLGIGPLPIVINEYTRPRGDLSVPGKLVPWMAHLEASKVYGCLAFWTPAGTLSDLVARTWPNRPTGAWWLYKWYGGMTGDTVSVSVPDNYGFGLHALAAVDEVKKQARILFGGSDGAVKVTVKGLDAATFLGKSVHVTVWGVNSSGIEPSGGPDLIEEQDYPSANGEVSMSVPATIADSAYYLVVTPAARLGSGTRANRYEAEYADLSGAAKISYGAGGEYSGSGFVEGYAAGGKAATEFVVSAPEDGYYDLALRYAIVPGQAESDGVGLSVDGTKTATVELPATVGGDSWASWKQRYFLAGGIHRFSFQAMDDGSSQGLRIDSLDLTLSTGDIASYGVEDAGIALEGTARLTKVNGRTLATGIGGGEGNFLEFRRVKAAAGGTQKIIVTYTNNEQGRKGQVERYAEISTNGGPAQKIYFRNTFDPSIVRTVVIDVALRGGDNSIRFANSESFAPDIVKIEVAAP
jgi:hypothetical protein